MGMLLWSAKAKADLEKIAPDIREQFRRNAEVTLPDTQPCTGRTAEGNYHLFYRQLNPEKFEVLRVLRMLLWSEQAEADLETIAPDIREQIRRNAEVTLPDTQPCTGRGRGAEGIMWHRGITHDRELEVDWDWDPQADSDTFQAWDYYLYYRELNPEGFEVLRVLSTRQIANMSPPDADDEQ